MFSKKDSGSVKAVSTRRHFADMVYEAASRAAPSKHIESKLDNLPSLSLYTFATSVMTLGNRVMKIGKAELGVAEFFSWQRPAMTLTLLFAYTLLCYHPQWLVMIPLFYFVFSVLVPNYAYKFKLDEVSATSNSLTSQDLEDFDRSSDEKSKAKKQREAQSLLAAVKKGQQMLSNVVEALDKFDEFRNGPARFSDPQTSTMMLLGALGALASSAYALTYVSIPFFFAFLGWGLVCSKHPLAKLTSEKLEDFYIEPQLDIKVVKEKLLKFCHDVVLVDDSPLVREVEIFELQPLGLTARSWAEDKTIYSTDPYFMSSKDRSASRLPQGLTRLSDVLAPEGWYFNISDMWTPDPDIHGWLSSQSFDDIKQNKIKVEEEWACDRKSVFSDGGAIDGRTWRRRRLVRPCYHDFK